MANWLKILLSAVSAFGVGAGTASQVDGANTTGILITGVITAATAVANLFVQKPGAKQ